MIHPSEAANVDALPAESLRPAAPARAAGPRQISLRGSLAALVALCVLPSALIAGGLALANYRLQRDWVYLDTVLLARRYAAELDRELAAIESGLRVLASAPELADDDLGAFHARARAALEVQPFENYLLTDREGRQRVNAMRPPGESLVDAGTLAELGRVFEQRRPVVTSLHTGAGTGTPRVALGVPVFRDGRVVYSLAVALAPQRIAAVLDRHPLPDGWVAAVLDSSGTIVARSRDAHRFVGQRAVPAMVEQMSQGREGSIETETLEGAPVVSSFSRSAVSEWSVAVGAPRQALAAGVAELAGWVGFGVAFAALVGGLLARRVAGGVAGAVRDLNDAAIALVEGRPVVQPATRLREAEAVASALQQASGILARTRHLAHHDALTGLSNRALFEEHLHRQLAAVGRSGRPLAALAIDLDGFKAVNDLLGHAAGDRVLQAAAARIARTVRAYDVAARLGGDEFAVLLPDIGADAAQQLADRLVDALAQPYGEGCPPVSASIGIATTAGLGEAPSLLERADRALYAAKRGGKRRALMLG